jgi:ABC-type sugar transport system permease subunit
VATRDVTEIGVPPRTKSSPRRLPLIKPSTIRDNITGYFFISPALLLIFIFGILPIGYAIHMSLHKWRIQQTDYYCEVPYEGETVYIADAFTNTFSSLFDAVTYRETPNLLDTARRCLVAYEANTFGSWNGLLVTFIGFTSLFITYLLWVNLFSKKSRRKRDFIAWQVALLTLAVAVVIVALNQAYDPLLTITLVFVIILGGFWFWNTSDRAKPDEPSPLMRNVVMGFTVALGAGLAVWGVLSIGTLLSGALLLLSDFSINTLIVLYFALLLLFGVYLLFVQGNEELKNNALTHFIERVFFLSLRVIGVTLLANITVAVGLMLGGLIFGGDMTWSTATITIMGTLLTIAVLGIPFQIYALGDEFESLRLRGYVFLLLLVLLAMSLFGISFDGQTIYAKRILDTAFLTLGEYLGGIELSALALFYLGFLLLVSAYRLWVDAFKPDSRRIFARWMLSLAILAVSFAVISYGWNEMFGSLSRRDQDFLSGLEITVFYAFGSIPFQLGLGLLLAYILFQNIQGKEWFRIVFFLPYVTPAVAAAVVFQRIFTGSETALMNSFLASIDADIYRWVNEPRPFLNVVFGLDLDGFIAGPSMALVSVVILGVWTYTGYNAVIFLAGLGGIPNDLYEAAKVDGASQWHLFRYITMPLLSPITFYLSLLGFIGVFQAFNTLFVMRTPSAQGSLDTAALVIYDTFQKETRYGEAAAQAIVLFIVILILTQLQRNVFEKRVFYG